MTSVPGPGNPVTIAGDDNPLGQDLDRIVALAERDWRALAGARILLTGGTGFFGTWIVESFVRANRHYGLGARLHVLSRNPSAFLGNFPHLAAEPSLDFVSGDIRSIPWPSGGCTHVIHAATATSGPVATGDPEETYSVITEGTHHVLRLCREHGVKRCLLVSSGAVYGRQPSEITHVPETFLGGPDPTAPSSAYGEGKRAAELLAGIYSQHHGVETPIARCFAFCWAPSSIPRPLCRGELHPRCPRGALCGDQGGWHAAPILPPPLRSRHLAAGDARPRPWRAGVQRWQRRRSLDPRPRRGADPGGGGAVA